METLGYDELLDRIARSSYIPWTRRIKDPELYLNKMKESATHRLDELLDALLSNDERKYDDDDLVFELGYRLWETYQTRGKLHHEQSALFIMDFSPKGAVDCVALADTFVLALARLGRYIALSKVSINTIYNHMWITYEGKETYTINATSTLTPFVTGGLSTLLAYNYANSAVILNNCKSSLDSEKYVHAIGMCDKGLTLLPHDLFVSYCKAFALFGLKKYDEALDLLDKNVKNSHYFMDAIMLKAWMLEKLGRHEEARTQCKNAISLLEQEIAAQKKRIMLGDIPLYEENVHEKEHLLKDLQGSLERLAAKAMPAKA